MRKRYEGLVSAFVDELGKGHSVIDATQRAAARQGYQYARTGSPMKPLAAYKKAQKILGRPEVVAAIRDLYFELADFSPVDGAQMLVRHIKGDVTYEETAVTKDGAVLRYEKRLPPSLEALKAYNAITLPKPTKQVNIDQRVLVAKVLGDLGAAPDLVPRSLETEGE